MRKTFATLSAFALLTAAPSARAVLIEIDGVAGANGVSQPASTGVGAAGGAGGAGESVDQVLTSPDASNQLNASGGAGGRGGNGANTVYPATGTPVSIGGDGGDGGAGGSASSRVTTSSTGVAPSGAAAEALGGSGGNGGNGGTGQDAGGHAGKGGNGGSATAIADVSATTGYAFASANAEAGRGGNAGGSFDEPGGAGGNATGRATSFNSGGTSEARAIARGGNSSAGGTPAGSDPSWMNGGDAEASAVARAEGGNAAYASAEAWGGTGAHSSFGSAVGDGGTAHATAAAYSDTGLARVSAAQLAGSAAGGPGQASVMTDQVTGSTAGQLWLIQNAWGGYGGGAAESNLTATNPGGGPLLAEVSAIAGPGGLSGGAPATAVVHATGRNGARIEAHANAEGGSADADYNLGLQGTGGDATSLASAFGLGELVAHADLVSHNAGHGLASSLVGTSGPLVTAGTLTELVLPQGRPLEYGDLTSPRELHTSASISDAAPFTVMDLPALGSSEARLFASPSDSDVASWLAGNPVAQAARAGKQVLAVGSFGTHAKAGEDPRLLGTFQIDLTSASYAPGTRLYLAFLDPVSVYEGLDLLHLTFTSDFATVFDTSFGDNASALAALDDTVIDLGVFGEPVDVIRQLGFTFALDMVEGADKSGFAVDFALLAAPVPEPGLESLCVSASLALVATRRRYRA
jgi:hypothetical protein